MAKVRRKELYSVRAWESGNPKDTFVRMHTQLTTSPAYTNLTSNAKAIYTALKQQYRFSGSDDYLGADTVIMPYTDIEKATKIRRGDIKGYLDELEMFGFIKCIGGMIHLPNKYTFTDGWTSITEEQANELRVNARKRKAERKKS